MRRWPLLVAVATEGLFSSSLTPTPHPVAVARQGGGTGLLPSPTSCLGDGGCPGPAPLRPVAAAASLRACAVLSSPRSLCALKPETAAASRTLRPGAAGQAAASAAVLPTACPLPTASAGATSRTVSPGRGDRHRGAESAGGPGPGWGRGTELPPSPPQPRPRAPQPHLPPRPRLLPPSRSPGIPAASAVRPPFLPPDSPGSSSPQMRRYRTSALDNSPPKNTASRSPLSLLLTLLGPDISGLPGFPSDMPERVTRGESEGRLGEGDCACPNLGALGFLPTRSCPGDRGEAGGQFSLAAESVVRAFRPPSP